MTHIVATARRVARKHHKCGACYWFSQSNYGEADIDPVDWLIVSAAIADRERITPGTHYIEQVASVDGTLQRFRARLDMHNVCMKYDLYPED